MMIGMALPLMVGLLQAQDTRPVTPSLSTQEESKVGTRIVCEPN